MAEPERTESISGRCGIAEARIAQAFETRDLLADLLLDLALELFARAHRLAAAEDLRRDDEAVGHGHAVACQPLDRVALVPEEDGAVMGAHLRPDLHDTTARRRRS